MNHKVSMKIDGKWVTVGNVKVNQWGNLSLGLRKSPEVRKALDGKGWANFALFEQSEESQAKKTPQSPALANNDTDKDIPF